LARHISPRHRIERVLLTPVVGFEALSRREPDRSIRFRLCRMIDYENFYRSLPLLQRQPKLFAYRDDDALCPGLAACPRRVGNNRQTSARSGGSQAVKS